jgi:hypothetical protein
LTTAPVSIIRTSDRMHFKKCRRAWDYSSKIRQNLEPIEPRQALEFGTAFHSALEVYYDPAFWHGDRDTVKALSQARMREVTFAQKRAARGAAEVLPDNLVEDFAWREKFGPGMLNYFFDWAKMNDNLTPVYVEIEFEVPIIVPDGIRLPNERFFRDRPTGHLYFDGQPVVYQGRIDMIARDSIGRLWIVDHKTAARLDEWIEWLELDEQMTSYAWAIKQQLGIDIYGVLYSEHVKGFPMPPEVLSRPYKGRMLSTNKNQNTSFDLMIAAIKEHGELEEDYQDYLWFLEQEGKQYIRRTEVPRSEQELENMGKQIAMEAIDMLNDPFIYPRPDKFNCKYCDHRLLCLATNDGSDTKWIINTRYRTRT